MIALKINKVKDFMNCLLRTELFDSFLLAEATITTNVTYTIEGELQKDFYSQEELESLIFYKEAYVPYGLLRNNCFQLIKGSHTPLSFRFIFHLPAKLKEALINQGEFGFSNEEVRSLHMILQFQNGTLQVTSGISYNTFRLDHDLDQYFDHWIKQFLSKNQLEFEEI